MSRSTLRHLAARQDGQFSTGQARELGITASAIRALVAAGEATPVRRGVWRFIAAPGTPDAAVSAYLACWPHAVVSHASAARFHGLSRVPAPASPEVTVPRGSRNRPAGITVHSSVDLPPGDVLVRDGIRYTSLARTVCDLADRSRPWQTLALLDDAVALGAKPRWIHQRAAGLAAGRDGVALLTRATAPGAADEFRSWLERTAAELFRRSGLPPAEWNVPVRDARGLIGIVDAFWAEWRLVVELEGLRFHTSPAARRTDARRFNRLQDAGLGVRRFTWDDVVHRPDETVLTVARALQAAGCPTAVSAARVVPIRAPWRT